MDTLTHSLLGGLTSQIWFNKYKQNVSRKECFIVGAVAAAFPDIDYLLFWIDPLKFLADWHRASTHSFVMLPLWAILLGTLIAFCYRKRQCWAIYSLIAATALVSHILTDIITVYGTKIFSPFSDYQLQIGTTFVVDGYFTAIIILGIIFTAYSASNSNSKRIHVVPIIVISLLFSYCLFQLSLKLTALDIADQYASELSGDSYEINALPQPFSPFNWLLVIESDKQYAVAHLDLSENSLFREYTVFIAKVLTGFNEPMTLLAQHYKIENEIKWQAISKKELFENEVVLTVWHHEKFEAFRRFARFPVHYRTDKSATEECVWFTDLRYVLPHLTPPFRYGMCRTGDYDWRIARLIRNTYGEKDFF